jgi:hypothetical protein
MPRWMNPYTEYVGCCVCGMEIIHPLHGFDTTDGKKVCWDCKDSHNYDYPRKTFVIDSEKSK